jgi:spore germination cell wall hydrolase CwlJ-like protein
MKPDPELPIEQQSEKVLCRMCLWAEARGEPALGKLAILSVIDNLALRHADSMKAVILHPKRFSSFNENDPNRDKLMSAYREDPLQWMVCDVICELHEARVTSDPTVGADHYYNPAVAQPAWGRGAPDWKEGPVIGHHVFGNCP